MKLKTQMILLILTTVSAVYIFIQGYQEEKRLTSLDRSFTELFNDRLIAESCVFKMNDLLHEKQAIHLASSPLQNIKQNAEAQKALSAKLQAVYTDFKKTKLSSAEITVSKNLSENMVRLGILEFQVARDENKMAELKKTYTTTLDLLEKLSEIQVTEGTRLNDDGHKTLASAFLGVKLDSAVYLLFLASLFALARNTIIQVKLPAHPELN